MALLPVQDALDRLLAGVGALGGEPVKIDAAHGRVLAEDVAATLDQPPFAASAMDGYAIRWDDLPGPWRVIGQSAAGRGFGSAVGAGEAVRIFTGAPLPAGADTVVVQEDITHADAVAALSGSGPPRRGAHIRAAGQDFARGDRLAAAGDRLTPARIGLLAAAGHGTLSVVRRPRVTLIATGDELVLPGTAPGADQIVSSNPAMLRALLEGVGAMVIDPGIIADDRAALAAALTAADAELIVTTGGASVGDHDLVVPVLRDLGAEIDFWKIAMRPGKPMLAGRLGNTRVIGLPGNPVSAFVCALLFAVPMLARLGGRPATAPIEQLPLAAALPANDQRRDHIRARRTAEGALPFASQDSARLGVLAAAELLIIREPGAAAAAAGECVACIALDTFSAVS
ncbi:gephyrin-like molybdotransferase Glp [Polymorphobacter fuscus]|uniref:Molybdopterin molybdenumtransferase n=1 Tax=Sandarakinorhabdus fusca TaxID=1439888 RepID=A0A7C9GP02_9SPHN|nr:gephyrin-like molybdotransferase Glp [Polymorphobacter fuscus]KAB7648777.1 molybdopterin molybdotransferase MoeA [Polymorphobacter fuscus]MQT16350.1 molybdopterin molybdenumtransferase MoeA [Polymorphobacter fuscus]NJC07362.1 molybdopterin molybdotransferase [Polymorphobacter fuscus]